MPTFVARSRIPAPADRAFAWHARPGALERLLPPWDDVRVVSRTGGIAPGAEVVLSLPLLGPVRGRWVARHTLYEEGRRFRDEQVSGPFARWVHTHTLTPAPGATESACILEDRIEWTPPLGMLGGVLAPAFVEPTLRRVFAWRHARTAEDLARHEEARAQGLGPSTVAISGASGMVGSALAAFLTTGGHEVVRLERKGARAPAALAAIAPRAIAWDPEAGTVDRAALEGVDAVVHLAGSNVAEGRWTDERKRRIRESRVRGTTALAEALVRCARRPRVVVSASAIGWYGSRGDEVLDERSAAGEGFLAEVCRDWEGAWAPVEAAGVRVVRLRTGIVLSAREGALAKMLTPFRLGLGGPVGGGRQWQSWISLDDVVDAIHAAIARPALSGAVNAVAPEPIPQRGFAAALGRALSRPALAPLPAGVVRLLFGEMGEALLLASQRVSPRALLAAGFRFRHPTLEGALASELGRLPPLVNEPG